MEWEEGQYYQLFTALTSIQENNIINSTKKIIQKIKEYFLKGIPFGSKNANEKALFDKEEKKIDYETKELTLRISDELDYNENMIATLFYKNTIKNKEPGVSVSELLSEIYYFIECINLILHMQPICNDVQFIVDLKTEIINKKESNEFIKNILSLLERYKNIKNDKDGVFFSFTVASNDTISVLLDASCEGVVKIIELISKDFYFSYIEIETIYETSNRLFDNIDSFSLLYFHLLSYFETRSEHQEFTSNSDDKNKQIKDSIKKLRTLFSNNKTENPSSDFLYLQFLIYVAQNPVLKSCLETNTINNDIFSLLNVQTIDYINGLMISALGNQTPIYIRKSLSECIKIDNFNHPPQNPDHLRKCFQFIQTTLINIIVNFLPALQNLRMNQMVTGQDDSKIILTKIYTAFCLAFMIQGETTDFLWQFNESPIRSFIKWALANEDIDHNYPVYFMISSFCLGQLPASIVNNFFDESTAFNMEQYQGLLPYSWEFIFMSIRRFMDEIDKPSYSSFNIGKEVTDSIDKSIRLFESILVFLKNIIRNNEMARMKLFKNRDYSLVPNLFFLLSSNLSNYIKSLIFDVLAAFIQPSTLNFSKDIWEVFHIYFSSSMLTNQPQTNAFRLFHEIKNEINNEDQPILTKSLISLLDALIPTSHQYFVLSSQNKNLIMWNSEKKRFKYFVYYEFLTTLFSQIFSINEIRLTVFSDIVTNMLNIFIKLLSLLDFNSLVVTNNTQIRNMIREDFMVDDQSNSFNMELTSLSIDPSVNLLLIFLTKSTFSNTFIKCFNLLCRQKSWDPIGIPNIIVKCLDFLSIINDKQKYFTSIVVPKIQQTNHPSFIERLGRMKPLTNLFMESIEFNLHLLKLINYQENHQILYSSLKVLRFLTKSDLFNNNFTSNRPSILGYLANHQAELEEIKSGYFDILGLKDSASLKEEMNCIRLEALDLLIENMQYGYSISHLMLGMERNGLVSFAFGDRSCLNLLLDKISINCKNEKKISNQNEVPSIVKNIKLVEKIYHLMFLIIQQNKDNSLLRYLKNEGHFDSVYSDSLAFPILSSKDVDCKVYLEDKPFLVNFEDLISKMLCQAHIFGILSVGLSDINSRFVETIKAFNQTDLLVFNMDTFPTRYYYENTMNKRSLIIKALYCLQIEIVDVSLDEIGDSQIVPIANCVAQDSNGVQIIDEYLVQSLLLNKATNNGQSNRVEYELFMSKVVAFNRKQKLVYTKFELVKSFKKFIYDLINNNTTTTTNEDLSKFVLVLLRHFLKFTMSESVSFLLNHCVCKVISLCVFYVINQPNSHNLDFYDITKQLLLMFLNPYFDSESKASLALSLTHIFNGQNEQGKLFNTTIDSELLDIKGKVFGLAILESLKSNLRLQLWFNSLISALFKFFKDLSGDTILNNGYLIQLVLAIGRNDKIIADKLIRTEQLGILSCLIVYLDQELMKLFKSQFSLILTFMSNSDILASLFDVAFLDTVFNLEIIKFLSPACILSYHNSVVM